MVMLNFCQFAVLSAALLFLCFPDMRAQPAVYSYEQMEKLLLKQNPGLCAARERVRAATHILQATGPKYWPRLTFYYRHFPDGVAFQEGDFATRNWLTGRFAFDVIKYFRLRSLRKQEKQADVALEKIALQKLQLQALFAFRKLYVRTLNNKIQADYFAQLCSTSVQILQLRKIQLENQEALKKDVLAAEIELQKNTVAHENNLHEYQLGKSRLAIALRIDTASFELKDSFYIPFIPQQALLLQSALENDLQSRRSLYFIQRELARSRAVPVENLSFEPYLGYRVRELRRGELEAGPEFGVKLGLGMGYFAQKNQQKKYFEATRKAIRLEEENTRQNIIFTIKTAYSQLLSLKNLVLQKNEELRLLRENLRIEQAIAEQGIESIESTPVHLLELQAGEIHLETAALEYKSDYMEQYFELMHLSGISWPEVLRFRREADKPDVQNLPRALWVWKTPSMLLESTSADSLINFCRTKKIDRVFLSFPGDLQKTLFSNRRFMQLLVKFRRAKIPLAALLGDPHWILPQNRENLLRKIRAILEFNRNYASARLLAGVHLDIEPHTLAAWSVRKDLYLQFYLETIMAVKREIHASGQVLPLEIDIPLQFGNFETHLLAKLADSVDVLTIMAYNRREPRQIAAALANLIRIVQQANKKYRIGLNCTDFANLSEFDKMTEELHGLFSEDKNYAGIAIHNFATC